MIQVFLLDDHDAVRHGLAAMLEPAQDIEIVGESGSAQEAIRMIPGLRPDVAVLDARLPDGSGVSVCRDVRSADPRIKALMLTTYQDDEALFEAIMAGASGYMVKQLRGPDVVTTIRAVASGDSLIDPSVSRRVLHRFRTSGPSEPEELAFLTPQERSIFELIAEGMTNRQIGSEMGLKETTVKDDVSSLLTKLGVERPQYVRALARTLPRR
jgi:DNA-binding NarL/FixJ family response regulator